MGRRRRPGANVPVAASAARDLCEQPIEDGAAGLEGRRDLGVVGVDAQERRDASLAVDAAALTAATLSLVGALSAAQLDVADRKPFVAQTL